MAHSTVTHTCGHTSQIAGRNRKDADRRAEWAGRNACWECEKQAATDAARRAAEAAGLPALTGSEKQIAYAEALRAAKLTDFAAALGRLRAIAEKIADAAVRQEALDALILLEDEVTQNASARFWIEADSAQWRRYLVTEMKTRHLCDGAMKAGG